MKIKEWIHGSAKNFDTVILNKKRMMKKKTKKWKIIGKQWNLPQILLYNTILWISLTMTNIAKEDWIHRFYHGLHFDCIDYRVDTSNIALKIFPTTKRNFINILKSMNETVKYILFIHWFISKSLSNFQVFTSSFFLVSCFLDKMYSKYLYIHISYIWMSIHFWINCSFFFFE